MLATTDADYQRTAQAGTDDLVGIARAQDSDGVSALEQGKHLAHGLGQVAIEMVGDQLSDHLGVGGASKDDPFGLELAAQRSVVFYDSVVDHGHAAVGGK